MIDDKSPRFDRCVEAALQASLDFMEKRGITELTLASDYPDVVEQARAYVLAVLQEWEKPRQFECTAQSGPCYSDTYSIVVYARDKEEALKKAISIFETFNDWPIIGKHNVYVQREIDS